MRTREEKNKNKREQIDNIEKKEIRAKVFKRVIKIFLLVSLIFTISYFYTKYISTNGIIVKENALYNEKLPENFSGIKVIQFSDLHYGSTVTIDEVKSIVKIINLRKPDIIVFTGDLIDKNYKLKINEQEEIIKQLQKLNASVGKYAVSGEEDEENFSTILNQSDFNILDNSYDLIYKKTTTPILITGISSLSKQRNINQAFSYFNDSNNNKNIYTITLLHEPDSIDEILNTYPTDLALAGHSHNGQIKIPYVASLIRKDGAIKYPNSHYKINNTNLYVSSGIGTSDIHFRLGSRPSINFLRLRTK